jgi:hypothetical protein
MDANKFTKLVVSIVDYLVATKKQHKRFKHKNDLLEAMHLKLRNYSAYKDGSRDITDKEVDENGNIKPGKHKHIRQYLINEYNVNPNYLEGRSSQMFIKPLVSDDLLGNQKNYTIITQAIWEAKLKECEALKRKNEELKERILKLQERLIEKLEPALSIT